MRFSSQGFAIVAALVPLALAVGEVSAQTRNGRLFYEMVVTNAGTRSQGWHGILYDADGRSVAANPGVPVETSIGVFEAHACLQPWTPCGFIRAGSLPQSPPPSAVLNDPVGWGFRLFVSAEGTRSEGWRGELRHGTEVVPAIAGSAPVNTQMGRFVSLGSGDHLWGWHGWSPEAWQTAVADPK